MPQQKRPSPLVPALFLGALLQAPPALVRAESPFLVVPDAQALEQSPAYRYANMRDIDALAELDRRGILYSRVESQMPASVQTPIRLTGRLHGVYFHSSLPPEQRVSSPFEILDARLALALDDFAALLEEHDIDEVVHFSLYRPNGPHPSSHAHASKAAAPPKDFKERHNAIEQQKKPLNASPAPKAKSRLEGKSKKESPGSKKQKNKAAAQSKQPEIVVSAPKAQAQKSAPKNLPPKAIPKAPTPRASWAPPGTRHPAGLAIDIGLVHKKDGRWLNVLSHFQGQIDQKACPADMSVFSQKDTRDLRAIACDAMERGLFTYILTPNYNAAHADHYHMEIKPGVRWFLIH